METITIIIKMIFNGIEHDSYVYSYSFRIIIVITLKWLIIHSNIHTVFHIIGLFPQKIRQWLISLSWNELVWIGGIRYVFEM